jgi:preprotein translocase subunit YajC
MKNVSFVVTFLFLLIFANELFAQTKLTLGSYKNIYDMLKDVPGLEVTTNGGKAGNIIIRGISSFKSQQPP